MTNRQEQRLIIKTFRSGVPSRRVASRFPMGREKYLEKAFNQSKTLRPDGTQASIISANYGEGKTHLLHAVWDLALREECVVSLAILSKETPFDKLHKVYPKVIAGTYVPGSSQPGIEQLVADIRSGSREADEIIVSPRRTYLRNWAWSFATTSKARARTASIRCTRTLLASL
ncbi:MAG: BREX system ATP-binding domain-containing protein [Bacillota bacterium]